MVINTFVKLREFVIHAIAKLLKNTQAYHVAMTMGYIKLP